MPQSPINATDLDISLVPNLSEDGRQRMAGLLRRYGVTHDDPAASTAAPAQSHPAQRLNRGPASRHVIDAINSRPREAPLDRRTDTPPETTPALLLQAERLQDMHSIVELRIASARLAQVNEDLRVLLDVPIQVNQGLSTPQGRQPQVVASPANHQDNHAVPSSANTHEEGEAHARRKRRRLNGDGDPRDFGGFRYGRYGQIMPGVLKMRVSSCDGGTLPGFTYAPENILCNDKELVYCSQKPRCNIVLCHKGEVNFDLQRLVIRAPEPKKFTCPVKEGLVFVAMSEEGALERTVKYQIHYLRTSRFAKHFPGVYDANPDSPVNGIELASHPAETSARPRSRSSSVHAPRSPTSTNPSASPIASPTAQHAPTGKETSDSYLEPIARFRIPDAGSKVVITFDTPVAARFVLLKLWSGVWEGNVDVGRVEVKGYVGVRWFPAVQLK